MRYLETHPPMTRSEQMLKKWKDGKYSNRINNKNWLKSAKNVNKRLHKWALSHPIEYKEHCRIAGKIGSSNRWRNYKNNLESTVLSQKVALKKMYYNEYLSTTEISKRLKITESTLPKWLKICGFKKRQHPQQRVEYKKYMSALKKKQYSDPVVCRRIIEPLMKAWKTTPNKLEQMFMDNYIKKFNLPLEFSGDGKFFVGRKCPDFINKENKIAVETRNKAVTHYLDHKTCLEYSSIRRGYFKRFGYKCVIIWDDEINSESIVINKLQRVGIGGGMNQVSRNTRDALLTKSS